MQALSGVDILTETGDYKSTYEILSQIADVWEKISDMDQAALLELLAGKRNASVLAAILQAPEQLKAAYEDANNAQGSALKENEKYMDSIQGKIDQFTNAIQTLWKNVLDDDVVKFFVEIGTELVKILDKLGPIKTLLAGIAVYAMRKNGIGNFAELFGSIWPQSIDKTKKKIASLKKELADLERYEGKKYEKKRNNIRTQLKDLEASVAPDAAMQKALKEQQTAQKSLDTIKANKDTGKYKNYERTLKSAETRVKNTTEKVKQLEVAQQNAGKTGSGAFKKIGASVAKFAGQVAKAVAEMLVMMAVVQVVQWLAQAWDDAHETAAEAAEAFEELTNELEATKNELDGIQDELKTIDEQIADIRAKGKLSFVDSEELNRLESIKKDLERELELKKDLADQQQEQVNLQTLDQIEYYKSKSVDTGKTSGESAKDASKTGSAIGTVVGYVAGPLIAKGVAAGAAAIGGKIGSAIGTAAGPIGTAIGLAAGVALGAGVGWLIGKVTGEMDETVGETIDRSGDILVEKQNKVKETRDAYYSDIDDEDKREEYEKAQKDLANFKGDMAKYFTELGQIWDNVNLGDAEDDEAYAALKQSRDEFYNQRDKWLIDTNAEGAKQNAIDRILDKKAFSDASEKLDELMAKLKENPADEGVKQDIEDLINGSGEWSEAIKKDSEGIRADLTAVGISTDDVVASFTQMAEAHNFGTIDGKIEELKRANEALKTLLNSGNANLSSLFYEDGEVIQSKLSEIFKNTSTETRQAITSILESNYKQIQDGTLKAEDLLIAFATNASTQVTKILEENTPDWEKITGDIDKIQDAYSTLSNAVEQYNSAGYMTMDQLQSFLSLEPEYLALLKIENGQMVINQEGYKNLVKAKLAEAKAAVVLTGMEKLQALATKSAADEIDDQSLAASNSLENLNNLSVALSDVAKKEIAAATGAYAFQNALAGAQANEFVTDEEINEIISMINNGIAAIDAAGAGILSDFDGFMTGGEGGDPREGGEDSTEWENLLKKHQAELDAITHEKDLIQAEIDEAEARGEIASEEHYKRLIELEQQEKDALIRHQQELQDFYNTNSASMSADEIDKWNAEMRETELAIKEADKNMIEFGNTIREIGEEYFDKVSEDIDAINEEIEFMHGLLEDEPVADENGNWSNEALTRLGLYTQQMEKAAFETQRAKDELAELQATTSEANKNTDWYREREEELTQTIYDNANAYNDYKDGIVELNEARVEAIKEGIEQEISAMEDLISLKKEELDSERDLYDFKRNVEDQNRSIAETERKLAALSSDTSAEGRAEAKRLQAQLNKDKRSLDDLFYDHSIDSQQSALDEESEAFETAQQRRIEYLESTLENVDELIVNSMMDVMLNADTVHQTLNEQANIYGVTLSEELTKPWLNASAQAVAWRDELKRDMTEGEWAAMIGEGGAITAFSNGVATKLGGSWDTAKTKTKAYADFLTGTELKNNLSGAVTTFTTYLQKIVDKWNEIRNAAVAATAVTPTVPSGGTGGGSGGNPTPSPSPTPAPKETPKPKTMHADGQLFARTVVSTNLPSTHKTVGGVTYVPIPGTDYYVKKSDAPFGSAPYGTKKYKYYAKGSLGVDENQWALTDELGPELTMYATKDGTLSFMRAGSTVIPAELTKELMDIGAVGLNGLMKPKFNSGVNVINNAINKPEYNFNIEALVKADHIDQNSIKEVEKMVSKQLDEFTRKLNYSLKGVGGR